MSSFNSQPEAYTRVTLVVRTSVIGYEHLLAILPNINVLEIFKQRNFIAICKRL